MPLLERSEARSYRRRIRESETRDDAIDIRNERRGLRDGRRSERREAGRAPDQVIAAILAHAGRALDTVVVQEHIAESARDMTTYIEGAVADGLDLDEVVDQVLDDAAETLEHAVDLSSVPIIGWLLEIGDDIVARQIVESGRAQAHELVAEIAARLR